LIFENNPTSRAPSELTFEKFKHQLLHHCGDDLKKFNFSEKELASFLLLNYLLGDIISEHVLYPSSHE